jgi:hypothetical protein
MTDWTLTLTGGPRNGDRITTADLLPFLVFTTGDKDGQTTDHYYGPTSTDPEARVAVYEPVDGPENALAQVWEQGIRHALEWLGQPQMIEAMTKDNPYRRTA